MAEEKFNGGFVRDTLGRLVLSSGGTEGWISGFVRDSLGRLVVVGPEGVPITGTFKDLGEVSGATQLNVTEATAFNAKLKGATEFEFPTKPTSPVNVSLLVEQDATGGRNWSIKGASWLGGEPTFQTTAGKRYQVNLLVVNGEIFASTQLEPAEAFNPATKLLYPSAEVFKEAGASAKETKQAVAEPISRGLAASTATNNSGTPRAVAIPVAARTTISGVMLPLQAAESTPANRTHLWVALLNSAGEVIRRSADYTSPINNPIEASNWTGFKFTEPFTVGSANTIVYAVICEVVSSGTPLANYIFSGAATLTKASPVMAATLPTGQTTPEAFTGTPTMTAVGGVPYMALF